MLNRAKYGEPLRWLKEKTQHTGQDCLLWPYGKTAKGYGTVRSAGRTHHAHRLLCLLAHGPAPESGLEVAHSCGNRACVNPLHLRYATSEENAADMVKHGRSLRGARSANSKLDEQAVRQIRRDVAAGRITQSEAARRHGVSPKAISLAVRGINWQWVPS